MSDNKKHHIRISIESDDPESRAIGILKMADLLHDNGIHLSTELNVGTSRALAKVRGSTSNSAIAAVMVETSTGYAVDLSTWTNTARHISTDGERAVDEANWKDPAPVRKGFDNSDGDSIAYFDDMLRGAQAAHAAIRFRESS